MAIFSGIVDSKVLGMETALAVALPQDYKNYDPQNAPRVLYLLHEYGGQSASWLRWTAVERYAKRYGLALILPEVQRSFYIDMAMGPAYFRYLTEELPELCRRMFGISARREDTFVAGASMGGYGALKCALSRPELYGACAGLSGAYDMTYVTDKLRENPADLAGGRAVLGETLDIAPKNDLFLLAEKAAALPENERPRLFLHCGTEDYLYESGVKLRRRLDGLGYSYVYEEGPGNHDWEFWDPAIRRVIQQLTGA
jgi:S-formylglutathione hydrolase FrmB